MKSKIKAILKPYKKQIEALFNIKIKKFKIKFNEDRTYVAASYRFKNGKSSLHFNEFYMNNAEESVFEEIVIHEFAHLVTRLIYVSQVMPHGKEWKSVMRCMGVRKPMATTSAFTHIRKTDSEVKVKCSCKTYYFTKHRITKMNNGARYFCKHCQSRIRIAKDD